MSRRDEVRADLVARWMEEAQDELLGFPMCEIRWDRYCQGLAIEAHEIVLRSRGGSIYDRANVKLTCRHCHDAVHANPQLATQHGFMRSA